jgi:RHS repeat-associated protein
MPNGPEDQREGGRGSAKEANGFEPPTLSLPKGGGAINGIGEKFAANPATGTGSFTIPIAVSAGRSGFGPSLSLAYDSGRGNGSFGLGWTLSVPSITRRTDKGLPQYEDEPESDIFILSDAEDLVPGLILGGSGQRARDASQRDGYLVTRYRPRVEGLFARIERWSRLSDGDTYWRSISKDNITTLYGSTAAGRVADPDDPNRIFTWLISESRDDRGNAISYEYAAEDSSNVDRSRANERNRTDAIRTANRYLKRIKYGNLPSLLVQPDIAKLNWLFEVVFDYGEGHYSEQPPDAEGRIFATASVTANQPWPIRDDPFSRYRSCFELRTYRLCRRVLMFHHFPNELGVQDCLVRTLEFGYDENPIASLITSATQSGFVRQGDGSYLKRSLPAIEFEYSQAEVRQEVKDVDPASLANIPGNLDGSRYRWLDLDGEGLQSVLAEQDDGWYYKRNVSPLTYDFANGEPTESVRFEPLSEVAKLPAFAEAARPRHQFLDLAGDGQLDCVVLQSPIAGFYKRTEEEDWEAFAPLPSSPNVDWEDRNLRFVDVDGDGLADVLVSEDEVFTWYPSLAEAGFGAPIRVPKARHEEAGPAIVFADPTQSIFLADMSGDGLTDIVRIRNGEVCYWPNLGYGRFGRKVAMDQAPWLDSLDQFDPRRIRLTDVDGSGVSDLIYLAPGGVRIYLNQSGNAWAPRENVPNFPPIDDISQVQALDLLGNGTSCLVWTSPLPGDVRRSMRYIDLMGGEKPYLLICSRNNLGAETRVFYAPSTKFYLTDRQAGQPWATRLPFPVQVVERVETYDRVGRNRFVSRYAYHHGYYDGIEREFRGFGMVEQIDTEELGALSQSGSFPDASNIDAASYVPPVLTRTWFHTGAYPNGAKVTRIYDEEYYRESDLAEGVPGLTEAEFEAMLLPDTVLPPGLDGDEIREAIRSLKGAMLRQEIYAADGTPENDQPYAVAEKNYTIRMMQPFGGNRHAVFFTHARESIDFHYERKLYDVGGRKLADPRVTHSMVLAVDDYGNELQSATIAYGRRHDDPDPLLTSADRANQRALHATYSETAYTNPILEDDTYRAPLLAEVHTFELIKVAPDANVQDITNLFGFDEMATKAAAASDGQHDLPYEDVYATGATEAHPYRRLVERVRTLYLKDDLSAGLPLGGLEPLALSFQSYKLAFTPGLLPVFQRGGANLLPNPVSVLRGQGGYVLSDDLKTNGLFPASDPNGHWWIPSGQVFYSPNPADPAASELANARAHFFLPRRFRDPFQNDMTVLYDAYDLLVLETEDALQNKVTAGGRAADGTITAKNDYRVLQPTLLTEPNGNRSAAAFDGLGLVAGTAVMGKANENLGDSLAGFAADLVQQQIDQFFANPTRSAAAALLSNATSRIVYDVGRYTRNPGAPTPVFAATIARETHVSDLAQGQSSDLQLAFGYSDGFGREIQRKIQAESGTPGWVASGWTIFNNKGKPVRQYEPFFDNTNDFKFGLIVGVSPILFYDPVGRVVATAHPDHSWEKVVFDPWRQESWDRNDTVLIADPKTDADAGAFFARLPDADYLSTWYSQNASGTSDQQDAAQKASLCAATPATAFFDTLGRTFLTVAFNLTASSNGSPVEEHDRTFSKFDIEGNQRWVTDALNRKVMTYDYDMLGNKIHQVNVDAGERWMLNDVSGKSLFGWDSLGHQVRHDYDALRRPANLYLQTGANPEVIAERIVFGEGRANPEAANLRAKVYQQFDAAGVVTNGGYDFKGNLLTSTRQLLQDYKDQADWSQSPPLEVGGGFTASTTYDAMNRPVSLTSPDASVIRPLYNERGLLSAVSAKLRGGGAATQFVTTIAYNAKGQRESIGYGNGASTSYTYDANTFRLTHLTTSRSTDNAVLQDLQYAYDPIGNVTRIADGAQETLYFSNQVVTNSGDYAYDALYRLTTAKGREHIGQLSQPWTNWDDLPRMNQPLPTDGQAMRNYSENYVYDAVGNILQFVHQAANGNWTRTYTYDEPNLPYANNRLTSSRVGGVTETYQYNANGDMTAMPQLATMGWDFKDQLHSGDLGGGGAAYYVYGASGQRARKVIERQGGLVEERIYLGAFEVYRKTPNGTVTLESETLHVMDDKHRIALVETKTVDGAAPPRTLPATVTRYQFDNHLGSAIVELDENAAIISYEEYYPFGSTSYQAVNSAIEVSAKRYRYTGKERDDESGLYYHGARYYAPWLARWTASDPAGLVDGMNLYQYSRGNPIKYQDRTGNQSTHVDTADPVSSRHVLLETADPVIHTSQPKSHVEQPLDQIPGAVHDVLMHLPGGVDLKQGTKDPVAVVDALLPGAVKLTPQGTKDPVAVMNALLPGARSTSEKINFEKDSGPVIAAKAFDLALAVAETHFAIEGMRAMLAEGQGSPSANVGATNVPTAATGGESAPSTSALPSSSLAQRTPVVSNASGPTGSITSVPGSSVADSVVVHGSGTAPKVAPNQSTVPLPNPGETPMGYGTRVHQDLPSIVGQTNPGAGGQFNVAPGRTGPDLENPTGMNATFGEMKSLWGRQAPMLRQASRWGFDAQTGRYFFYDRETGIVFEGIIQTEKFPSGAFR